MKYHLLPLLLSCILSLASAVRGISFLANLPNTSFPGGDLRRGFKYWCIDNLLDLRRGFEYCIDNVLDYRRIFEFCIDNLLLLEANIEIETKSILKNIEDSVTIITCLEMPAGIIASVNNPKTDEDVRTETTTLGWRKKATGNVGFDEWEKHRVMKIKHKVSKNFSTVILGEDDNFGAYSLFKRLYVLSLRNRFFLPLEDSEIILKNDELAERILIDLKLEPGKALPITYESDFNMVTDESFSCIFFYGMGTVLLAKQEQVSNSKYGPFVVDMPFQDLKTRKLYRKYGARIHFSEDQKVTAIYDYCLKKVVKPGETGWEAAKTLAKVTAFFVMTARDHLVW